MSLVDIFSLDGLYHTLTPVVEDRVLKLRQVSKSIKLALESNLALKINIHINDTGVESLNPNFLQRWHGSVRLHYKRPWKPGSRWLQEVRDDLSLDRLRQLSLLSLSVEGSNLNPLVEMLVGIGTKIQQMELSYRGNGTELAAAAAALGSLGRALIMDISVEGSDPGGSQTSAWIHHLASSIRIDSLSLRSARPPTSVPPSRAAAASTPHPHPPWL
jgi:hypothetical protein